MKDKCHCCGQKINAEIYKKHIVKIAKENGMPSFAKLLKMIDYKN